MLRTAASIVLLLASIGGPAFAMDPSATEETNCLMACDANQEHCAAGPVSGHKNHSPGYSSPRDMKSSLLSRRAAAGLSRTPGGVTSPAKEGQRWSAGRTE